MALRKELKVSAKRVVFCSEVLTYDKYIHVILVQIGKLTLLLFFFSVLHVVDKILMVKEMIRLQIEMYSFPMKYYVWQCNPLC